MNKKIFVGENMKFKKIKIKNIGNISDLELQFNSGMNVICGSNGVGKTTIINTMMIPFFYHNNQIKKKFGSDESFYEISYFLEANSDKPIQVKKTINATTPEDNVFGNIDMSFESINDYTNHIFYFSINRDIQYKKLENLSRLAADADKEMNIKDKQISSDKLKDWMVNRYLVSGHQQDLKEFEKQNYELMKKMITIIDPNKSFVRADARTYEIILNDRGNEVYLEYESAGFKAVLYILLGIIFQIENRFSSQEMSASEFQGVIIIDEIDLHLHPTWQNEIIKILKQTFTKAQFILTTHSPSVLQSLENDEIIALEQTKDNGVQIKKLDLSEYGLKGWTLEEILSDVMGVKETKNNLYTETFTEFDEALNTGDVESIKLNANKLKKMLHPNSPLKQIIDIQTAGFLDD